MSVQIGAHREEYVEGCHHLWPTSSSCFSYLYNSDHTAYRFADPHMEDFSLLRTIEILGKKVIFTINPQRVLYYDSGFINSLPELFAKIKFPQNLNQEMLDKIAIIANYLSLGEEYKYLRTTAKQLSGELTFLVQKGEEECCRVTLPSFKDNTKTQYEVINEEDIFSFQY